MLSFKETRMTLPRRDRRRTPRIDTWMTIAAFGLALLMIAAATQLHAQTYTVLHNFTGGSDGGYPYAGLTLDAAGNLYGTTPEGAIQSGHCYPHGCGTVFKLKHTSSGWLFSPLYLFQGKDDSGSPYGGVTFGRDGTLYGTVSGEGTGSCGAAFNLKPPPAACTSALCSWSLTVIHSFSTHDGCDPFSSVIFDQAGNLYGTTGASAVYELSPSNGGWTETVLHSFSYGDGAFPGYGPLIFDKAGNLYGTTSAGGDMNCEPGLGCGVVYQLTTSGSGWTDTTLYKFQDGSDGAFPNGGVVLDASGNLYGTTTQGGSGYGGTVFELSPFNGYWNFNLLYSLTGGNQNVGGAWGTLVMDAAGNLYGTTANGGAYGEGAVFKLTPSSGGWAYTSLHDFVCSTDGCEPYDAVIFDAKGNMYGTASGGGANNHGVVWEITP
jgi:uncharacterized repeat protein (TIGR03803 family)